MVVEVVVVIIMIVVVLCHGSYEFERFRSKLRSLLRKDSAWKFPHLRWPDSGESLDSSQIEPPF